MLMIRCLPEGCTWCVQGLMHQRWYSKCPASVIIELITNSWLLNRLQRASDVAGWSSGILLECKTPWQLFHGVDPMARAYRRGGYLDFGATESCQQALQNQLLSTML